MQAVSITMENPMYLVDMTTGRPSTRPRTPFGQRLLGIREAAGLSQAQVAAQLGITQNAYAYWERNPVALRPDQFLKLAEVLKISMAKLVGNPAAARRRENPAGKARQFFEEVSKLPRRQQEKIFALLQPFVDQYKQASSTGG